MPIVLYGSKNYQQPELRVKVISHFIAKFILLKTKISRLVNFLDEWKFWYRFLASFNIEGSWPYIVQDFSHKKLPETPPSWEFTMTSNSARKKTSLSLKLCIPDKKRQWMLSGSHDRFVRIRNEKSPETPPWWEIKMTSYPVCNITSLSRKPRSVTKKLL